jgi:hypothetical protein
MSNFEHITSTLELGDTLSLLHGGCKARYAELLSPQEAIEMAAEAGIQAPPQGWVIHAELSSQDIEHVTQVPKLCTRLVVQDFDDGLPVVILTAQVKGLRLQWAIAMWEADAELWLRDSVERGRVVLMLSAIDTSVIVTLVTSLGAIQRENELLEAVTVQEMPTENEHLFYMLNAGLLLMSDTSSQFSPPEESLLDSRVMMVGRGVNAIYLMNTFAAGVEWANSLLGPVDKVTH